MAANSLDRHLTQLEACRYRFGRDEAARVVKLLKLLDAARFPDSPSLIRFHEAAALPPCLSARASCSARYRTHS